MIIDTHMHLCPRVGGTDDRLPLQGRVYGRAEGQDGQTQLMPPSFERTDSPPELALAHMDWLSVDRAFLVQGPMYGFHNKYVAGAVARWPERFLGFAIVDPTQGDAAAEELQECRQRGLMGLKVEWPATARMFPGADIGGEEEWKVWRRAKDLGMVLYLHLSHGAEQVEAVRSIARDLGITTIIAHLGGAPADGWEQQVALAKEPNVYIGTSAVPYATKEDFPAPRACELLEKAVGMVGADKIMWGSDYPGTLTRLTYPQTLEWVRTYTKSLSAEQVADILGNTAERVAEGLWP